MLLGQAAVELPAGPTRAAKLNIGKSNNPEGTCSRPPESEGGEGGKQRKQDREQEQSQDQVQDEVQEEVQDEVKEQVQASNKGRIVLVAGRGSTRKKRKEGEMKLRRIDDLIARMGGGKRTKIQGGQGEPKRVKNVCPGV